MVKAISYAKVKTDKVDAKTLAELLIKQISQLQTHIHRIEDEIEKQVPFEAAAQRLMEVPGLGKVGACS